MTRDKLYSTLIQAYANVRIQEISETLGPEMPILKLNQIEPSALYKSFKNKAIKFVHGNTDIDNIELIINSLATIGFKLKSIRCIAIQIDADCEWVDDDDLLSCTLLILECVDIKDTDQLNKVPSYLIGGPENPKGVRLLNATENLRNNCFYRYTLIPIGFCKVDCIKCLMIRQSDLENIIDEIWRKHNIQMEPACTEIFKNGEGAY